ncbi:TPA: hypothetical protein KDY52_004464 [Vibrio parahaemolyticus]|uniref:hypothetical protein n=1 Tax=Vibrio parahaemolyticus TaxID=670 RepID=UPI00046FDB66|nr:hypothetical protein [Vibrio parahaemolyticus]EJE4149819.1 hypothetical protein [Vibrio parahaemolyticus]MQP57747.1 hypothetical protein [Vibrio parahaemolyticus]MQZ03202.1 hypothetical protein [Vibrio parahaemolyticus]MQZ13570.1 hypothetical protein [Vibrio parahaemolyticus]HBC3460246.1 hypothetical protein [Vibrio parahaemolyticus]
MIISELNVSDGQVTEFSVQSDVVTVVLKDWQDEVHTLIFKGVVGVESYSPEGVDLCHIKVLTESEKVRKVCSIVEADEHEFIEYSFISAWSDLPVLSVFSENVEII